MIDKEMLEAMSQLLSPIIKEQQSIREDLQAVKADTARLVTIEKKLDVLTEAHMETRAKVEILDDVAERVEEIQITVNAMEAVTKQNCTDIKQLRIAK